MGRYVGQSTTAGNLLDEIGAALGGPLEQQVRKLVDKALQRREDKADHVLALPRLEQRHVQPKHLGVMAT